MSESPQEDYFSAHNFQNKFSKKVNERSEEGRAI